MGLASRFGHHCRTHDEAVLSRQLARASRATPDRPNERPRTGFNLREEQPTPRSTGTWSPPSK